MNQTFIYLHMHFFFFLFLSRAESAKNDFLLFLVFVYNSDVYIINTHYGVTSEIIVCILYFFVSGILIQVVDIWSIRIVNRHE